MKTNDIKKGMRVHLRNGWYGTMSDNAKGNTRVVLVEGLYTEMGSVYSHDIMRASKDGVTWEQVEHTPAQNKVQQMADVLFGG